MSSPSGGLGAGNNAWEALPRKRKRRSGRSGKGKKQTTEGLGSGSFFFALNAYIPDGFDTGDRVSRGRRRPFVSNRTITSPVLLANDIARST